MMFFDAIRCSMMFYDVLCLKSIFGFLLSEGTSGVSSVIFHFIIFLFVNSKILFSETMLQMWTDFARFGDPNGDPQRVSERVN